VQRRWRIEIQELNKQTQARKHRHGRTRARARTGRLPWRTQPYPVRSEPPTAISEPKSELLSINLAIGMDAGGGDLPCRTYSRTFWTQLCFFGFDFEFQKYISKNSQLLFRTHIFILLLKNDIIPLIIIFFWGCHLPFCITRFHLTMKCKKIHLTNFKNETWLINIEIISFNFFKSY
jgi:hypothetical protein